MYSLATSRLRVLVADDCPDTRKSMRMLLKAWGHDCRDAADGEEAVRLATDYHPDVVFLDILMPGVDGYEAARRVRHVDPTLRLIAMTGHTGPGDVLAALDAGFDHFLVKPCAPKELESLLRSFADERPLEVAGAMTHVQ
ncbi:MAG: response regulator [Planctomycetes bacterium]|nr:response regulator [Planctomycetota bacterium]